MNRENFGHLLRCWIKSRQTIANPVSTSTHNSSVYSLYARIFQALVHATSVSELKQIHAVVTTKGYLSKSVLASRLIASYARFLGLVDAKKLFENLPKQTVYTYNYMLNAYVDRRCYESALSLYSRMISAEEIIPDHVTLTFIVQACVAMRDIRSGKLVHARSLVTGVEIDLHLATALLDLYTKCQCVYDARNLFDRMPQRDVFAWTVMVYGYLQVGNCQEAFHIFSAMKEAGLRANVVTWNALIAGCVHGGFIDSALRGFKRMQVDGIKPDKVSLCTILPALTHFALLKLGLEAHAYIVRMGFELDLFVISSLIDMYAKCGNLVSARYLFDQVKEKDVGLWNTMIVGYGIHGNCKEALRLFHQMGDVDVRPNDITFTSILSSCSHAGMVLEGRQCFDSMLSDYGILPRDEHYACMVDMFGRAGKLEEAYEFIQHMPIEANEDVWGAFLGACRNHRHSKLAEIAAEHIYGCNNTGRSAGYHVVMANLYAENGRWGDVARVRTSLRDSGFKKKTGLSWIEAGGIVHTFDMADSSHPKSRQIYDLLRIFEDVEYQI